jgi:hypothetical protein
MSAPAASGHERTIRHRLRRSSRDPSSAAAGIRSDPRREPHQHYADPWPSPVSSSAHPAAVRRRPGRPLATDDGPHNRYPGLQALLRLVRRLGSDRDLCDGSHAPAARPPAHHRGCKSRRSSARPRAGRSPPAAMPRSSAFLLDTGCRRSEVGALTVDASICATTSRRFKMSPAGGPSRPRGRSTSRARSRRNPPGACDPPPRSRGDDLGVRALPVVHSLLTG